MTSERRRLFNLEGFPLLAFRPWPFHAQVWMHNHEPVSGGRRAAEGELDMYYHCYHYYHYHYHLQPRGVPLRGFQPFGLQPRAYYDRLFNLEGLPPLAFRPVCWCVSARRPLPFCETLKRQTPGLWDFGRPLKHGLPFGLSASLRARARPARRSTSDDY